MAILLANGADIEAKDRITKSTPLHWAASDGNPIQYGADPTARAADGSTPPALARQFRPTLNEMMNQE